MIILGKPVFHEAYLLVFMLLGAILSFKQMMLQLIALLSKQSVTSLGTKGSKGGPLRHKPVSTFEKLQP